MEWQGRQEPEIKSNVITAMASDICRVIVLIRIPVFSATGASENSEAGSLKQPGHLGVYSSPSARRAFPHQ